jgi:hypothetical protein
LSALDDPQMWGMVLVDIARHAARAYEKEGAMSEANALTSIVDMFTAELSHTTDLGRTTASKDRGH